MILVDTSVIADVLTKDPDWFEWSSTQIEHWANQGPVCYDAIVFAELAVKFDAQKELEHRLSAFTHLPLSLNAAFQAGKAFEKYRRAGGKKARPLPDFFIGGLAGRVDRRHNPACEIPAPALNADLGLRGGCGSQCGAHPAERPVGVCG